MKPCTARTRRCYDAKRYDVELRECCRAHIRTLMGVVKEALDLASATWWADYGTLLGAVCNPLTKWGDYPWLHQDDRDTEGPVAGIIPHDKDADLGVLATDWVNVRRAMYRVAEAKYGHSLIVRAPRGSMKLRLSALNRTNVDLFFWYEKADGTLYRQAYIDVDNYKGRDFHKDTLFPLTKVEWEGMDLPAPKNPEAFCEFRYGQEWRTPVMANHKGVRR